VTRRGAAGETARHEQRHLPQQLDEETRVLRGGEGQVAEARGEVGSSCDGRGGARRGPAAREVEQGPQAARHVADVDRARPAFELVEHRRDERGIERGPAPGGRRDDAQDARRRAGRQPEVAQRPRQPVGADAVGRHGEQQLVALQAEHRFHGIGVGGLAAGIRRPAPAAALRAPAPDPQRAGG
jgi:hypothetical protein